MDEGIKMMYKMMFDLDVDECKEIVGNFSKKEIFIDDKFTNFASFMQNRTQIVTIDHFSTKDKSKGLPDVMKDRYVELITFWGLVKYEKESIGYIKRAQIHNGFPSVIDVEELINDPVKTYEKAINQLQENLKSYKGITDFHTEPFDYGITKVFLNNEYYQKITKSDEGLNNQIKNILKG